MICPVKLTRKPYFQAVVVVGLVYVGLPLAVHFVRCFPVIGFDVDERRVADVKSGSVGPAKVGSGILSGERFLPSLSQLIDSAKQPI